MTRDRPGGRHLRLARAKRMLAFFALLSSLVLLALYAAAPSVRERLEPTRMSAELGHAVTAPLGGKIAFPYLLPTDSQSAPLHSSVAVFEDGQPLGPGHSLHDDIRQLGGGRFSCWYGTLYFSASDNSDPRRNDRVYVASYRTEVSPWLVWPVIALDLAAAALFWRSILGFFRRRSRLAAAVLGTVALLGVGAAAVGITSPIFPDLAGTADGGLVGALVLHLALGLGITLVLFGAGSGIRLLMLRGRQPRLHDLLLSAPLPGTLFLALCALLALVLRFGVWLALALLIVALWRLRGYRPAPGDAAAACRAVLLALPAALAFATVTGLAWHAPTATVPGTTFGDMPIYVAWAASLAHQLFPFRNLGTEGTTLGYGNQLPSLLMTPLLRLPWFDPFLFMCASLVVVLVLSLALLLTMFARAAAEGRAGDRQPVPAWIIAGLVAGAVQDPSWFVSSPPVVFLVPLLISTVYLWRSSDGSLPRLGHAMATAAIGSAISKVVTVNVLAPLILPDFARALWRGSSRRVAVALAGAAALAGVYVAAMLAVYLPPYLRLGLFGPPSWEAVFIYHETAPLRIAAMVARDIGAVLLCIAATRMGVRGLALAAWIGVACFFALPFLFHATLVAAMLVVALVLLAEPARIRRARTEVAVATLLLLPQPLFFSYSDVHIGVAWLLACSLVVAVAVPHDRMAAAWRRDFAVLAAFVWLLALPAAATGALHLGTAQPILFTPALRDIWLAVRERTPVDALIFTDQTGNTETRAGGWNDYALISERQFFVASWSQAAIRLDPVARAARLEQNEAVLAGRLAPQAAPLSRRYSAYFAVISVKRAPPPRAELVYRNSGYALYRLPG